MDHDKKKRNKKKNKQKKAPEPSVVGGSGVKETDYSSSVNLNGLTKEQDHLQSQAPEEANVLEDVSEQNADLGQHSRLPPNGTQESVTVETEKQKWLQREATLEETIKQLQNENHSLIQKEATSEEMNKQLHDEVYSHKQKEATLETNLVELQAEKDSWIEKEASLEMKVVELRAEKDSLIEKEAGLKERISKLLDGKASLGLKVESLEENIRSLESEKESWILKENTTKETIARLNDDITKLQAQVVELEESRKNLSQEKLQLVENVSAMQSQIQNLERSIASGQASNETAEHEELKSELEGQQALVAKLISENAELVEKVNELYVKLDQQSATVKLSSATGNDLKVETAETIIVPDPISVSNEKRKLESFEVMHQQKYGTFGNDNMNGQNAPAVPITSESREIGQISLDDNEIVVDIELQDAGKTDQNAPLPVPPPSESLSDDPLPLSDAPLIGAPLRLISFFARYVSGADLVNKSSSNS